MSENTEPTKIKLGFDKPTGADATRRGARIKTGVFRVDPALLATLHGERHLVTAESLANAKTSD